ncbi:MAG: hypothetical protein LC751_14635, partial [Actinobacteria bacterium]|nr:hypothetical protein [Actinomycetota bacterium]
MGFFRAFLPAFCLALSLPLLVACGGSETTGNQEDQGRGQETTSASVAGTTSSSVADTTSASVADDRGSWRTGETVPVPVSEMAVAELDGKVY